MPILECKISMPEIKDFIKNLISASESILKLTRKDIKDPIGKFLTKMMEAELTIFLEKQKYKRIKEKLVNLIVELFPSIRDRRKNLA